MTEFREQLGGASAPSLADALESCLSEQKKRSEDLRGNILNFFIDQNNSHRLLKAQDLNTIYGTLIQINNDRSQNAKSNEERQYYEYRSDMYTLYLSQHLRIQEKSDYLRENLATLKQKNIISDTEYQGLFIQHENAWKILSNETKSYISVFNQNACGFREEQKKTTPAAESVLNSLNTTLKSFIEIENIILSKGMEFMKKNPENSEVRLFIVDLLKNSHRDRFESATTQAMILANYLNIKTHSISEIQYEGGYDHTPDIDRRVVLAQQNGHIESMQKAGESWEKSFEAFQKLSNPSLWTSQGRMQISETSLKSAQGIVLPAWANEIMDFARGEDAQKTVTEYFEEFTNSPAIREYQLYVSRLADPNDDLYKWMKNPTDENQKKVAGFIEALELAETEYLNSFFVLVEKLSGKGVSHESLRKMIDWVNENLILILGGAGVTLALAGAMALKIMKSLAKFLLKTIILRK